MSSIRCGTIEGVDPGYMASKRRGVEPSGIEYVFSIRRGTIDGVAWIEYMGSVRRGIIS